MGRARGTWYRARSQHGSQPHATCEDRPGTAPHGHLLGDHQKPVASLRQVQTAFEAELARQLPPVRWRRNSVLTLTYSQEELLAAVAGLLEDQAVGGFIEQHLPQERPLFVGLSVMYSGQVLWALCIGRLARWRWPGVPVFFGGAHITALRDAIGGDPRYAACADGFVAGPAEQTVRDLIQALRTGSAWPAGVFRAGQGATRATGDPTVLPRFTELERYRPPPLALPARTSRGCAYGRCAFCTYPAIDGRYEELPPGPVDAVIELARQHGAIVSFKDSLLLPHRLRELARRVNGRVRWSGCTKLHPALDEELLGALKAGGCRTLEIGLETLVPSSQTLIDKPQSPELFARFLAAAAHVDLPLVVNVITGFPDEPPAEAESWLDWIRQALAAHPTLAVHLEHNRFELERLVPEI